MNMPKAQSEWTDARVALLRALWATDRGAPAIAAALNRTGSRFTANAVVSKAHRLCLPMKKPQPSKTARPPMAAVSARGVAA